MSSLPRSCLDGAHGRMSHRVQGRAGQHLRDLGSGTLRTSNAAGPRPAGLRLGGLAYTFSSRLVSLVMDLTGCVGRPSCPGVMARLDFGRLACRNGAAVARPRDTRVVVHGPSP